MANGGDKGHHEEKKVGRKESRRLPKKGTTGCVKQQPASKERAQ
jgi:hypothetical protein